MKMLPYPLAKPPGLMCGTSAMPLSSASAKPAVRAAIMGYVKGFYQTNTLRAYCIVRAATATCMYNCGVRVAFAYRFGELDYKPWWLKRRILNDDRKGDDGSSNQLPLLLLMVPAQRLLGAAYPLAADNSDGLWSEEQKLLKELPKGIAWSRACEGEYFQFTNNLKIRIIPGFM